MVAVGSNSTSGETNTQLPPADVGTGLPGELTPCGSPAASCWTPTCPGSTSTSAASPLKRFYQQIPSTTKLCLHLHWQRTVTVFTTNLVQDSGCYVQEKHGFVQASVLWVERSLFQHNAHFLYCSILNSFIKLSWVFFLPYFHLLILWLFPLVSAASLCRKKNQTIPSKCSSSHPDSLWLLATNSQNRPHENLF